MTLANGAIRESALLDWYEANKRDMPWRRTRDPYAIWVSEVMLQQTQVATVWPYYQRWMSRFPTVEALAAADEQEVLAYWQGLGYYRRCRMLHQGAKEILQRRPASAAEWLKVPGVGRYTAGAIASITLGERAAVVDGNVQRVYARLAGDDSSGANLDRNTWRWAEEHVPEENPGQWNQALMELGSQVCKPVAPDCPSCPVRGDCVAFQTGRTGSLPTPKPRPELVYLEHIVWAPVCDSKFGLSQIGQGEWWQGMWEFPRRETESELRAMLVPDGVTHLGTVRHSVTRHRIRLEAFLAHCLEATSSLQWFTHRELADLPMPAPQRKVLGMAARHCGIF